jgi:hypothetical protein
MVGILNALIGSFVPIPTAFDSIATATPSGTNTVTFSSIPSTYKHLQIRFIASNSNTGDVLNLRFNGDTATNYAQKIVESNGAGAGIQSSGNATGAITGIYVIGLNSTASNFSVGVIDVVDYASTTKNKTVRVVSGRDLNGGTAGRSNISSGLWLNTAAVNSLTLYVPNNYTTGTTFALYGIKG